MLSPTLPRQAGWLRTAPRVIGSGLLLAPVVVPATLLALVGRGSSPSPCLGYPVTARKPPPAPQDWEVEAVAHVVDGDTVDLEVRRPSASWTASPSRPSASSASGSSTWTPRSGASPATTRPPTISRTWLFEFDKDADGGLRVTTQGRDAFGRYLGDIYAAYDRPDTASDYMVRERDWPVWTG